MSTFLITGATSGLGLQLALRLAREGRHRLILPVRNSARGEALRASLGSRHADALSTPVMNLASLASVSAFLRAQQQAVPMRLDGVLLNAGVQSADRLEFTVDGLEATFAVNHLAHLLLIKGLLHSLSDGAVVGWTASGVHDPKERAAALFGFRGGRYTSAERLARGDADPGTTAAQACRDAYATSKLCNVVVARALSARHPGTASFFSYDPGLMPGTGLSRSHGPVARWIWHRVLPRLVRVLPGTTTPQESAATLARLLTGRLRGSFNGAYFNHSGRQLEPAEAATQPWIADDLMAGSDALLARFERTAAVPRERDREAAG